MVLVRLRQIKTNFMLSLSGGCASLLFDQGVPKKNPNFSAIYRSECHLMVFYIAQFVPSFVVLYLNKRKKSSGENISTRCTTVVGIVFRNLFLCPWLPTSLFGMVEGCKEPDQHQLVYGVSAIKGRKVVEKMCLQPGLTHSVRLSGSSLLNLWRLLSPRGHPHKSSCFLIRPPLDLTFTSKSQT